MTAYALIALSECSCDDVVSTKDFQCKERLFLKIATIHHAIHESSQIFFYLLGMSLTCTHACII